MTAKNQSLALAQIDDLARRALAGCGAQGQQLELIEKLEGFAGAF